MTICRNSSPRVYSCPPSEGTPELSGTTAILLVFQADGQHESITDVYVGLVHRVESHLYTPDQILDFVRDIKVDLKAVCNALKARGDPSKRHTFCLFVSSYGGTISVPTDPPYSLVYPMSYMRDIELDHFDIHNNPARTCLRHCICRTTQQFAEDDPNQCREYSGSQLILPHGAQYKERLFSKTLKPWNHWGLLTDPANEEPYPMELVGDFWVTDPVFKGCYGDSLLYTSRELNRIRWWWIHLSPYWGKIPASPAPFYLQDRQPKVMKRSPPRAATPSPPVESPKTKCSGGKGRPHHDLGCSSNMSILNHPDSTSSSKGLALSEQEKSPRARSSRKRGHSPSPSAESVRRKWKDVHREGNRTLNSTFPISSSAFDSLRSPAGSHSDGTELLPPSITLTPLGLDSPRQWQTTSDKSRHSLASIYTSPGFNLPGYPAAGPGNLTPTVPSLAGVHHVSSTWPTGMFASEPSSPHLTIDQANSIFKLATECQALGIKLAKQFQVLSGLEAMHHNSIQGMGHKTLTLGCSAWEATYSAILWDGVSEAECKAMTHRLCSEADAAWKEMHEVTRETVPGKMTMPKKRVGSRPRVMGRWHQMAKKGRTTLILKTPSLALARSSVDTRTQTLSPTPGRKSSPSSKSGTQNAPRRTAPLRSPAYHFLRKSHQQTRHSTTRPGKKLSCWTHILMPGIVTRLLKALWAGPPETP